MRKIEITNLDGIGDLTKVIIDGKVIEGVTNVEVRFSPGNVNTVHIWSYGDIVAEEFDATVRITTEKKP